MAGFRNSYGRLPVTKPYLWLPVSKSCIQYRLYHILSNYLVITSFCMSMY